MAAKISVLIIRRVVCGRLVAHNATRLEEQITGLNDTAWLQICLSKVWVVANFVFQFEDRLFCLEDAQKLDYYISHIDTRTKETRKCASNHI